MAINQINKYVWLLETIHQAGRITLKDINRRWLATEMSEGVEIPRRTFHKWRIAIEDMFGLVIENENCGEYRYYILNDEEICNGDVRTWLLSTIATSNTLLNSHTLKHRIILEDVPSGMQWLSVILEAMREGRVLHIGYKSYWRSEERHYDLEPFCLKLFKQRWYLIARNPEKDSVLVYSLDRIVELKPLADHSFVYPADFSPEEYFEGCYGVIIGDGNLVEQVKLRVTAWESNYLRSLPLHESQCETERGDDFCIFTYSLRPTYDFAQAVLSMGSDVEVLEPLWFRNQVAQTIANANHRYCNK